MAVVPDNRADWQKRQGGICSCRGSDDYCPCQNTDFSAPPEPSDDAYRVVHRAAAAWGAATSEDDGDAAAAKIIEEYGDARARQALSASSSPDLMPNEGGDAIARILAKELPPSVDWQWIRRAGRAAADVLGERLGPSTSPVAVDGSGVREAVARIVKGARLSAAFGREFRAGDGRLDDVDLDAADAILRTLSTPEAERLRMAIAGITDDYMTSEKHHPGYVLIPTAKFDELAALSTTPTPEASTGAAETVARILNPEAWERREHFQKIIAGTAEMPDDPDKAAMYLRSATRRVDTIVEPSLTKAREILAALSPKESDR